MAVVRDTLNDATMSGKPAVYIVRPKATVKAIIQDTADAKSLRWVGQFIGLSGSFAPRVCESIFDAIGPMGILCISTLSLSIVDIIGACSAVLSEWLRWWSAIVGLVESWIKVLKKVMQWRVLH